MSDTGFYAFLIGFGVIVLMAVLAWALSGRPTHYED